MASLSAAMFDRVDANGDGTVTAADGETLTVTLEATCGGEKVLGAARVVLGLDPA